MHVYDCTWSIIYIWSYCCVVYAWVPYYAFMLQCSPHLPGTVAARLGGAGSIRGLPSCRGLMLRLAVSWGIFRAVSIPALPPAPPPAPAPPPGSFPLSGPLWPAVAPAAEPDLSSGPVLKRTARLSPKKE